MKQLANAIDRRVFYCTAVIPTSVIVGLLLYEHGCSWVTSLAIPLSCVLLAVWPWSYLVTLFPVGVFYAIVLEETRSWDEMNAWTHLMLFMCVVLIAFVTRLPYHSWQDPWMRARTSRMHFSPVPPHAPESGIGVGLGDLSSLLWLAVATILGGQLASPLRETLTVGPQIIGLIPEVYFGMKMVFLFAITFFLARGILTYWKLWASPEMASVILRRELWTWQGGEARRVARALRRRQRT